MCSNVQVCRCCHQGECSWCVAHCIWGCAGRNIEHLWLMGWDSNSVCFVVVFVTDFWMFECSSILCCRDHFVFVSYCCIYIVFKCLYLYNLVTVQPPRSTHSSSLVNLARPPTTSSLRITDRSFQYASPRLWNQLPAPLHQPRTNLSNSASPISLCGISSISSINSPLSSSITPSLFHFRLKTFLFYKSFPS